MRKLSLVVLAALILASCGSQSAAPAPQTPASSPSASASSAPASVGQATIRFADVVHAPQYWNIQVCIEKGFCARNGVKVEYTSFQGSGAGVQALLAGAVDLIDVDPDTVVKADEQGADLRIFSNQFTNVYWTFIGAKGINSFADIKGKPVGISEKADSTTVLEEKLLSQHGLQLDKDYTEVQLGGNVNRFAALKKGAVAGAFLVQPQDFEAESEGMKGLASVTEIFKGAGETIVGKESWAKANPKALVGFLKGVYASSTWLADPKNEDEAVKIVTKYYQIDPQWAKKAFEYYNQQKWFSTDGSLTEPDVMEYAKMMVDAKFVPASVLQHKWTDWVDLTYQKEAAGA